MALLKVIKERPSGLNEVFQNQGNNEVITRQELVNRLKTGNSSYNENYYYKRMNDKDVVCSKPNSSKRDNLN